MAVSMARFEASIDTFLSKYAVRTRKEYKYIIAEWERFINDESKLLDLTEDLVWKWVTYQRNRKGQISRHDGNTEQCWKVTNRKVRVIKEFYFYINRDNPAFINPFDRPQFDFKDYESEEKLGSHCIPYECVPGILKYWGSGNKRAVRDRAFFMLLFATSCRKSEIYNLKISNVRRTQKGTLYLLIPKTKNKKVKEQALPLWCHEPLQLLLDQLKLEGRCETEGLWWKYKGQAQKAEKMISIRRFEEKFKECCVSLGLGKIYSLHCIRNTVINKALDDGMSPRRVQQISGHSSQAMVEYYGKRKREIDESAGLELKEWG